MAPGLDGKVSRLRGPDFSCQREHADRIVEVAAATSAAPPEGASHA